MRQKREALKKKRMKLGDLLSGQRSKQPNKGFPNIKKSLGGTQSGFFRRKPVPTRSHYHKDMSCDNRDRRKGPNTDEAVVKSPIPAIEELLENPYRNKIMENNEDAFYKTSK
jgi:hypothetical protein